VFISADTMAFICGLGLDGDKMAELVLRLDADAKAMQPVRSSGAERQARYRDNKRNAGVTRVTAGDAQGDALTVTSGPAKDAPAPTYTRGEDNLSRLVDTGTNLTSLYSAGEPDLDWPGDAKPSRAYLDQLQAAVREAAGAALNPTATKLFSLAPILALGRIGKGPPCDLQADVLPTIRARAAKAAPQSIGGWDYFTKACEEARDRRLAGAGEVRDLRPSGHDPPRRSFAEQVGAEHAAATDLALSMLKASNG
jgi:hypothetical protein